MFACKVCKAQQAHIESLQAEVKMLRGLISPQSSTIPLVQVEADAVLSGSQEPIQPSKDQIEEYERIQSEAARLLTGTY